MTGRIAGPVRSMNLPRDEAELARESSAALSSFARQEEGPGEPVTLRIAGAHSGREVEAALPPGAVRILAEVLGQMATGRPFTVVPLDAHLSTQQAADLLGVSRPYLVKQLEEGHIPFYKVGEQRRIRYRDLLAYIEEQRRAGTEALEELTAEAQRLRLYE